MSNIEGWIFGPGLPPTGLRAQAFWQGNELRVGYADQELIASSPSIAAAGFNKSQAKISWSSSAGTYDFFVSDPAALAVLHQEAPPGFAVALSDSSRASSLLLRRIAIAGITVALSLVVAMIGGWFLLMTASAKLARLVPPEQEQVLGEMALAQARMQFPLTDAGPAAEALRAIGEKLTVGTPHRYRWFVADHPALNAFAAPGGVVVVMSGMIRATQTPEELAGVLAHEVAHVELRHTTQSIVKALGLRGLVALFLGDLGGHAADVATRFTELKFSRDAELEADREGLRRLRQARIDPHAMRRIFETLAASRSKEEASIPAFLSTHPDSAERAELLQKELATAAPRDEPVPLGIDWNRVKASLGKDTPLSRSGPP